MKRRNISRRRFMAEASCAAVGSTTMLSTLFNLAMMNSVTASTAKSLNDYKALVCIQLSGGNDSFNMLAPISQVHYDDYAATRTSLALAQSALLPLTPVTPIDRELGLHPSMWDVKELFNQGNVALVANVGTLVEPLVDYNDYQNSLKLKPAGLFSHSDQQHHWQTSVPQNRDALGWGGRLAEKMLHLNSNKNVSMNISLAGRNTFQAGENILEYTISNSNNGAQAIQDLTGNNRGFLNLLRDTAVDSLVAESYTNIFKQTFAGQMGSSIEANELFSNSIAAVEAFDTVFPNTNLGRDLHMVAKVIAAQSSIGMNRQTFYVTMGGWDNHGELLDTQEDNLEEVNDALFAFYHALAEINRTNDVTTFTISDFARTLTSNGNGSDHAWGGNQIIMGGAVNGGEIYGTYPDLYLTDNPLNISSRGNLIPTTSTDEVFAELALWFGVTQGELVEILPNIGNFYTTSFAATPPIGFMNM